jgi:hypothetical protein
VTLEQVTRKISDENENSKIVFAKIMPALIERFLLKSDFGMQLLRWYFSE